jgi:16S rRNA (cytidine1402-2'-O)-methyltransferase
VQELLPGLRAGETYALVSDAGLPGVNDPGSRLVGAALASGVEVTVLPGPSAVETALVASGLVAAQYRFLGYLPRGERALTALGEELARWAWAAVAFESPQRLGTSLATLARVIPDRPGAVCRELTKRFEEIARGSVEELAERFAGGAKGEITLVLGADEPTAFDEDAAAGAVAELVAANLSRRQAADVVSRLTGVSRNRLYRSSL